MAAVSSLIPDDTRCYLVVTVTKAEIDQNADRIEQLLRAKAEDAFELLCLKFADKGLLTDPRWTPPTISPEPQGT